MDPLSRRRRSRHDPERGQQHHSRRCRASPTPSIQTGQDTRGGRAVEHRERWRPALSVDRRPRVALRAHEPARPRRDNTDASSPARRQRSTWRRATATAVLRRAAWCATTSRASTALPARSRRAPTGQRRSLIPVVAKVGIDTVRAFVDRDGNGLRDVNSEPEQIATVTWTLAGPPPPPVPGKSVVVKVVSGTGADQARWQRAGGGAGEGLRAVHRGGEHPGRLAAGHEQGPRRADLSGGHRWRQDADLGLLPGHLPGQAERAEEEAEEGRRR